MVRTLLTLALLIGSLCFHVPDSEAGWLKDKLKNTGKDLGGKIVDDTSDSIYDATRESQDPEEIGSREEEEMNVEEPMEEEAPWGGKQPAKKIKKPRSSSPVRTDLHFSADSLIIDPEGEPRSTTGQIFVDGARMRWDMNAKMDDGSEGRTSIIITGAAPEDKIYTVLHGQKMYMVSTVADSEEDFWGSFTVMDNPCDGYRSSKNLGKESFNGRETVHWECRNPESADDPENTDLWIDDELGIPIQTESSDGSSYELKNISQSRPSADRFKLPAGYKEFSWGN